MLASVTQGLLWYGLTAVYAILVALSVLSMAIIAERVWLFACVRIDFPRFLRRVGDAIDAADWERAWDLAHGSQASACVVLRTGIDVLTGSQADRASAREMINAVRTAEGLRLEGKSPLLRAIGEAALYLGAFGMVLALLASSITASVDHSTTINLMFLTPAALAFLVAIPAWLAAHVFSWRVRQAEQQMVVVAELLLAEVKCLPGLPETPSAESRPSGNALSPAPKHAA